MNFCKAFFAFFMLPFLLFAEAKVGPLNHAGIVVTDLDLAVTQWQSGTGNQFRSIQTNTYKVRLSEECEEQEVTLRSSFSNLNNPFLELVQATPAIGPWAPAEDNGKAPGYQGYAVYNIKSVGHTLKSAGFKLVAKSGSKFAFYRGLNGVLIKLVRADLVPPSAETNNPQALIVFGAIDHPNIVVYDYEKVKNQLAQALSLTWFEPDFNFPATPFLYAGIGIVPTDIRFTPSNTSPVIFIGDAKPHLGPFAASPTTSGFRIVYNAPAGSVPLYRDQLIAAGFALNASVEIPPGNLINAIFTAPQGYWLEVQQPF